ncbi:MAG: hypothetical protein ACO1N1_00780 [Dyadobacter fermentans]
MIVSTAASAQDKIIVKDGKQIDAKVLGTDAKYVRYKRSDNPNGPDYFIFRSDVLKIEYQNTTEQKDEPLKMARETAGSPAAGTPTTEASNDNIPAPAVSTATGTEAAVIDIKLLEQKAAQYKKRGTIFLTAGTAAIIAGAVTLIKLNGDYGDYKREIQATNDAYTAWYRANYEKAPPAGDLQKQESFAKFASPGIYFGAAALVGGLALDWLGIRNVKIAKKAREELAQKRKTLSVRPFYQSGRKTAGIRIALSF